MMFFCCLQRMHLQLDSAARTNELRRAFYFVSLIFHIYFFFTFSSARSLEMNMDMESTFIHYFMNLSLINIFTLIKLRWKNVVSFLLA